MPVLPDVASTIVVRPGSMRPSASAASIIATPMRSLTLPPGLDASTLANSSTPSAASAGSIRVSCTIGVAPTYSAMLTGIPAIAGRSLVSGPEVAARARQALGDVVLAALTHHIGTQLDVARDALDGEAARLEQAPQPVEVTVEVVEAGDVLGRPVEDVLVVVAAPRQPRLAVAGLLVGEL